MADEIRGKIRNKEHVPTKDYSGLRYDKITPTDIDGFLDFDEVDVAPLFVSEYRLNGKWRKPYKQITAREAIDQILMWHP